MQKQGEVRVVRKDQYIKGGSLQLQGSGFKRCASPLSAWETEQETVKKLKAKEEGEGNRWLSGRQTLCPRLSVAFLVWAESLLVRACQARQRLMTVRLLQPGAHAVEDRHRRCCSESTLQDDVVAIVAFCF